MSAEQIRTVMSRRATGPWVRTAFVGIGMGGAAVIVTALLGHPLMGLFGCAGLALGALNFFLLRRSVLRLVDAGVPATKKQIAFSSLSRLLAITAVAIVCAVLVRPDGIAVFAGLAVFQLVMGARTVVPALKELRQ